MAIKEIASRITGAAFAVSNELGVGFLEKVYETELVHGIKKAGLAANQQWPINAWCDGIVVGRFKADILVEDIVIVEAKAVETFDDIHLAQCLNYLKAPKRSLCHLLNFGQSRAEVKRIVNHF